LADNNLTPSRSRDDRFVQRAFKFIKRMRAGDIKAEERLSRDYPEVFDAFKVYDDTQSGARWIFEASVMANKPRAEIADYLHADEKMLEIYEKLFFDVRDSLEHPGWILGNILMPFATNRTSPKDPDVFWKAIAYYGGWEAVRSSWEIGHASPEALDWYNKATRCRINKNAFDAAHTLQLHSMNAVDAIKSSQDQRRLDHDTETPQGGDATYESMGALLKSMGAELTVISARAQLSQEEPRLQMPLLPDTMKQAKAEVIKGDGGSE